MDSTVFILEYFQQNLDRLLLFHLLSLIMCEKENIIARTLCFMYQNTFRTLFISCLYKERIPDFQTIRFGSRREIHVHKCNMLSFPIRIHLTTSLRPCIFHRYFSFVRIWNLRHTKFHSQLTFTSRENDYKGCIRRLGV